MYRASRRNRRVPVLPRLLHSCLPRRNQRPSSILYSSELVCGASNGVVRGATGQMISLLGGGNSVIARGEGFKLDRGQRCGLVSRDGEAIVRAGCCGIERG